MLRRAYGDDHDIAIMTYDSRRLNSNHLGMMVDSETSSTRNATVHDNLIIQGMEQASAFYTMIAESKSRVDYDLLAAEVCREAEKINNDRVAALVLECTNLSPYRQQICCTVNVPVFDILDTARFFLTAMRSEPISIEE